MPFLMCHRVQCQISPWLKTRLSCLETFLFYSIKFSAPARSLELGILHLVIKIQNTKLVGPCQNYSLANLSRFMRHRVEAGSAPVTCRKGLIMSQCYSILRIVIKDSFDQGYTQR